MEKTFQQLVYFKLQNGLKRYDVNVRGQLFLLLVLHSYTLNAVNDCSYYINTNLCLLLITFIYTQKLKSAQEFCMRFYLTLLESQEFQKWSVSTAGII
jgi:hypothetical protein